MSKKANCRIYNFKNYIQIQKRKCVLKLGFNNYKLSPQTKKLNTAHAVETKWDIRIYCQTRIFIVFIQRTNAGELMFKKIF